MLSLTSLNSGFTQPRTQSIFRREVVPARHQDGDAGSPAVTQPFTVWHPRSTLTVATQAHSNTHSHTYHMHKHDHTHTHSHTLRAITYTFTYTSKHTLLPSHSATVTHTQTLTCSCNHTQSHIHTHSFMHRYLYSHTLKPHLLRHTSTHFHSHIPTSIQFSSVTQLYPTLCDPMNRSTPGLPVHHQLQELTQTHVH